MTNFQTFLQFCIYLNVFLTSTRTKLTSKVRNKLELQWISISWHKLCINLDQLIFCAWDHIERENKSVFLCTAPASCTFPVLSRLFPSCPAVITLFYIFIKPQTYKIAKKMCRASNRSCENNEMCEKCPWISSNT